MALKIKVYIPLLIIPLIAVSTTFTMAAKKSAQEEVVAPPKKVKSNSKDQTENFFQSFVNFYENGIDEKLYLQTDKPYYSAGEQIWLKGYVLNAITHVPFDITQYIYVELIESRGGLASRVRVKRDSLGFSGYMKLDPELKAGDYTLCAYTRWMTNKEDDGYFFTKNIKIVNPITAIKEEEDSKKIKRAKVESSSSTKAKVLDYDLQFFPEGGALLANTPQVVAFKALAEDGLSTSIKGTIFNANNEAVGEFASSHNGMGSIHMVSKAGEQYYARVESNDGLVKEFPLPTVENIGTSIKVTKAEDKFLFQAYATDNTLLTNSYIVVHSRGRIVAVTRGDVSAVNTIYFDDLYDGVSVISLVGADNKTLSERVIFKRPIETAQLEIESNAENYASRKLANVRVKVNDSYGDPAIGGEFGVAVTDDSAVRFDESKGDITSYLLLNSEIKGYIEDPGLYFVGDAEEDAKNLDLLMLTQAWRRFDLERILNGEMDHYDLPYEKWSNIRGNVKGFFGNKAKDPKVIVLCSKLNVADVANIDKTNKFNLFGLDMPDSTTYILQAMGRKGGSMLTLNIFEEKFPDIKAGVFDRDITESYVPITFISQSKDKFLYDGGMTNIDIEEISVTTHKREKNSVSLFATKSTSREDLEMMPGQTLDNLIFTYIGMNITEEEVVYRSSSAPVRFIVNGVDTEYSSISMLVSDNIEQMEFYYGADASVFLDSEGGVFCITLREDYELASSVEPTNIAYVNQLGYQRAATFYQPKYDTPASQKNLPPDHRTTIYWNGKLKSDESGYIDFSFYTADKATTYTITIEGVTAEGEICRETKTIERTLID